MTKYQKKLKEIKIVMLGCLSLMCIIPIGFNLDSDLWCCCWFGASFLIAIIMIFNLKNKNVNQKRLNKGLKNAISSNALPLDKVNELYRYIGLENSNLNILRLYFNKDYTQRCVFVKQSNGVVVRFEKLWYKSDDEKVWQCSFANWDMEFSYDASSFYMDSDVAYMENQEKLIDFVEDKTKIVKKQRVDVDIYWKDWRIDSKELPFGENVILDANIKGKLVKNVDVKNNYWYDINISQAYLYFDENQEFDTDKNCKFKLLKNGKVVGIVRFYK